MIRYAVIAGLAVGLGVSYSQTRQPARDPVPLSLRTPKAAVPFQASAQQAVSLPDSFLIEVDGEKFRAGKYASPIPCWFVGGKMVDISGNVSKVGD